MRHLILSGLLAALLTPATAAAGLRDERAITEGLIVVGMAKEIGDLCPAIAPRKLRGINYLWSLAREAQGLGYSRAEIEAFVEDDAEKDRLEAIARERLAAKGARPGDAEAHCAVGRAEIAAGSAIGRFLSLR